MSEGDQYLLDTHVLLWTLFEPARLSDRAAALIRDPLNRVCVSAVTFWEISLKYGLGKLQLEGVTPDQLPKHLTRMGVETLPLTAELAAAFHQLPREAHKDPFDRMLIRQAIEGDLILISRDGAFDAYRPHGLLLAW